jgi:hypothetical protein
LLCASSSKKIITPPSFKSETYSDTMILSKSAPLKSRKSSATSLGTSKATNLPSFIKTSPPEEVSTSNTSSSSTKSPPKEKNSISSKSKKSKIFSATESSSLLEVLSLPFTTFPNRVLKEVKYLLGCLSRKKKTKNHLQLNGSRKTL